jgi:GDP-D-mannose 3',5'-epimerase
LFADFEIWGDGKQTRSFCLVDDCVEGVIRLMNSDITTPINLGSEEMISMNDMATLVMEIAGNKLPVRHIPGPEGVRGRNSNNDFIREKLGWAPSISLRDGLTRLSKWMRAEIDKERAAGVDVSIYASSKLVVNRTPEANSI